MDLKEYTNTLIKQDAGLSQQIEAYIKRKEIAEEQKKNKNEAKEKGLNYVELDDKDYVEYYNSLDEQRKMDSEIFNEEE